MPDGVSWGMAYKHSHESKMSVHVLIQSGYLSSLGMLKHSSDKFFLFLSHKIFHWSPVSMTLQKHFSMSRTDFRSDALWCLNNAELELKFKISKHPSFCKVMLFPLWHIPPHLTVTKFAFKTPKIKNYWNTQHQ